MQATPTPVIPYHAAADEALERKTVLKVMARLIPFMILLYLFNYLDRVNVSFAKLQMSTDLGFSEGIYASGASIFFIGYFIFEVPSNLIMQRVGARLWMARIMVTWGLVSASMMFVRTPMSFYALRLLLGIAEAGFFPGMILYLTYWIPANQRAKAASWFLISTSLSGVVGGPLADQLMAIDAGGLHGWQWLFLIEGIPSVVFGFVILFYLDDGPAKAKWLSEVEKKVLIGRLSAEQSELAHASHKLSAAFCDPRVWILCLLYGTVIFGFYVINFWTPSLIKSTRSGGVAPIGLLSAIPFLAAVLTTIVVGWAADGGDRPRKAVGILAIIATAGYAVAASTNETWLLLIALSAGAAGSFSTLGPFWALPSRFLRGAAAATAIGMINSCGNLLGGFIGPKVMGEIKDNYGTYRPGLWITAGVSALAAIITFTMVKNLKPPTSPAIEA